MTQFCGKIQFDESFEKYILERNHFASTVSGKRFNTKGNWKAHMITHM